MAFPMRGWARHPLQAFRCEAHYDERARRAWCRLWTCRNYGWACSDLSYNLAWRLVEALAKRYAIPEEELYGCHVGRVVWVDKKWGAVVQARELAEKG